MARSPSQPARSFDVVEVDGRPVGRLIVDRRPGDIRVVDISLVPHARGAGIGTRLLGDLVEEARSTGRIVSIHVEAHGYWWVGRLGGGCGRVVGPKSPTDGLAHQLTGWR